MSYRNLKLHTTLNLFVIIALSMIIINGVVAVFWHEHIVKQHMNSLETHLRIDAPSINRIFNSWSPSKLNEIQNIIGITQFNISKFIYADIFIDFRNNGLTQTRQISPPPDIDSILKNLGSSGGFLPPFFRRLRYMTTQLTSNDGKTTTPIGIEIDVSSLAQQIWNKEKIILLYILFNAAILTTIIFFRFRKTLFIPMDNLLNVANNYQLHDGLWSIKTTHIGEFDQLSQAMNTMVQRIEKDRATLVENVKQLEITNSNLLRAQQETTRAEKLAATGRLAAGFAHEIGNPVTIIQGYLELLQQQVFTENEKQDFITRSIKELQRIDRLLFDLMDLAKDKPQNVNLVSITFILEDVVATLQSTFDKHNISISFNNTDNTIQIYADPELIRQVLLNILLNAVDAIIEKDTSGKGTITCSTGQQETLATITISDNGIGFDEPISKQIFDPFFTTKPVGKGTGLGLSVVHRIIDDLGGEVEVDSKPHKGTSFKILIPQPEKETIDD